MGRDSSTTGDRLYVDRAVLRAGAADTECSLPETDGISSVALSASGTAATVTWKTDAPATSTVEYGTTTAYGGTVSSMDFVTSHSLRLTGLLTDTTYHFRILSQEASGDTTMTCDDRFKTAQSDSGLHAASLEWLDSSHLRATYDWCSIDSTWQELEGAYAPSASGIVGLGAYGWENAWGTVVIEGETGWNPSPPVISGIAAGVDTLAVIT